MKRIDSSPAKMREFCLTMSAVLALVGAWSWHKQHASAMLFSWWASIFFLFWFFVYPPALKPLQKFWMGLAVVLGFFVGKVILSILYFLAFTPIGLVLRLKGRDVLLQKPDPAAKTYWTDHEDRSDNKIQYERQY